MNHNFKFEVGSHKNLGKGCFAKESIKEGEIVCKMHGIPISYMQFSEKYGDKCDDLLQIGPEQFIELSEPFYFINHSCNPNTGMRNEAVLFALRNIPKGEEITYDYSTTSDDLSWNLETDCVCNDKNCRRLVSDFLSLPHDRREYYKEKGALPAYILKTYY